MKNKIVRSLLASMAVMMTVGTFAPMSVQAESVGEWKEENGLFYWYENGVKQGYNENDPNYRGKEIFDPASDAWYWLDNVQGGAKAVNKDVYQESLAGAWGDYVGEDGERYGKWVRYDENGHMIKGWNENENGKYYFDEIYGTMAKGYATIGTKEYYFNEDTGVLEREIGEVPEFGWKNIEGNDFWYENYVRQGYSIDDSYRGKEIFDPSSNAWYWLDNVDDGRKAVSKDVYQESLSGDWGENVGENGERYGKWVRYDENGHMIKGWSTTENGTYYFDETYGTMAKGAVKIGGVVYIFDKNTGICAGEGTEDDLVTDDVTNDTTEQKPSDDTTEQKPSDDTTEQKPSDDTTGQKPSDDTTEQKPSDDATEQKPSDDTTGQKPSDDTTEQKPSGDNSTNQDNANEEKQLGMTMIKDEDVKYQGTIGEVVWKVSKDGLLVITGKCAEDGKIPLTYVTGSGYTRMNNHEWKRHADEITSVFADVEGVKEMTLWLANLENLKSVDLTHLDMGNVTSMSSLFMLCSSVESIDLSYFDTKNVTSMDAMFYGCSSLKTLDLSKFDTKNVTSMDAMFNLCSSLTSLDISSFNTENVTNMGYMFNGCSGLTSLNVSNFDTKNVTLFHYAFAGCSGLKTLDVSGFDTSNAEGMSGMFSGCKKLEKLDLSSFDMTNVGNTKTMFKDCEKLTEILVGAKWDDTKVLADAFEGCGTDKVTLKQ